MCLYLQQGADARHYNLPTVEEIAAVVPGDGSENVSQHRDIILFLQGGGCIVSVIFIHHISVSIMFFSFLKERKAGIWTSLYMMWMIVHTIPKRLLSYYGMLIVYMFIHQKYNLQIFLWVGGCCNNLSVMHGLPLINPDLPGLPTIKKDLGQNSTLDCRTILLKMGRQTLAVSFFPPLTRVVCITCNNCFRIPWPSVKSIESPTCLSLWLQMQTGLKLLKTYCLVCWLSIFFSSSI